MAFVGADGSGKSTVIRRLLNECPTARYIYMGAAIDSANYALPTSRWLTRRKKKLLSPTLENPDVLPPVALFTAEQNDRLPSGRWFKILGLINRVAEEWYRQLIVQWFKARGFLVLCDRHFLFDHRPFQTPPDAPLSVKVHDWLLRYVYPRPDLVIFLDAPTEVLNRRKPEWTLEHLENQRAGILHQGLHIKGLVSIDAEQPIDRVHAQVVAAIRHRREDRR